MIVIDRPAPSPRPAPLARQRGGAGTWLLALLVLGGIAFAVYWFVLRDQGGAGSARLASSVVPASADGLVGIDAGGLLSSPDVEKLLGARGANLPALKAKLADAGIKIESLRSLVLAADLPDGAPPALIVAVEADADVKSAESAIQAVRSLVPAQLAGALDLSNVQVFDGIVLAGAGPMFDQAKALASGAAAQTALAAPLLEVKGAIDTGAHVWGATALPPALVAQLDLGPLEKFLGAAKPTHAAASIRIGSKIDLTAALRLDGGDAKAIADAMSGGIGVLGFMAGKDVGALLKALVIGSTGSTLTLSLSLSPEQLAVLDKLKGIL
ncbi:MAG: hypothetical protein IT385_07670 [Deltaproteobacteria bacterium]|nr:hypothetical protein [Deltaproteobacteria bacterium]